MKYLTFLLTITLLGCQSPPPPPTAEELAAIPADAPSIFVGGEQVGLEGLSGLYLGQTQEDAERVMRTMCKRFVELDGGWKRGNTMFKGCHLPDDPMMYTFRVGFSPKLNNRVFTLEVKRRHVDQDLVRKRAWQIFGPLKFDYVRTGFLRFETAKLNIFSDWEDGANGPTHILIGLTDAEVARLGTP